MLPRVTNSVSRSITKTTAARPAIQKRFFGDPHADNGAEAVGTVLKLATTSLPFYGLGDTLGHFKLSLLILTIECYH